MGIRKVKTYGLKMNGLCDASEATRKFVSSKQHSHSYLLISYNVETGDIITNKHGDTGANIWSKCDNSKIIKVCFAREYLTRQEIANQIATAMHMRRCRENEILSGITVKAVGC